MGTKSFGHPTTSPQTSSSPPVPPCRLTRILLRSNIRGFGHSFIVEKSHRQAVNISKPPPSPHRLLSDESYKDFTIIYDPYATKRLRDDIAIEFEPPPPYPNTSFRQRYWAVAESPLSQLRDKSASSVWLKRYETSFVTSFPWVQ